MLELRTPASRRLASTGAGGGGGEGGGAGGGAGGVRADRRQPLYPLAIDQVGVAVSSARGWGTGRARSWHRGGGCCRGGRGWGNRYGPCNRHDRNGRSAVHDRTVPRPDEIGAPTF